MSVSIREIPSKERPRERLERLGVRSLSDAELLAILLRSGGPDMGVLDLSMTLINDFGGLRELLFADFNQLASIRYLGSAKVSCLKAVGELAKRCISRENEDRTKITKPSAVFELIRPRVLGKDKEILFLISLDLNQKLIKTNIVSIGTLSQTLSDCREVLRAGLINNAVSIIVAHNHPSGSVSPSKEDKYFTKQLAKAAPMVGLVLLDHVILTSDSFFSFKSEGLLNLKKKGGEN
jgi:DNA repair protein RadC